MKWKTVGYLSCFVVGESGGDGVVLMVGGVLMIVGGVVFFWGGVLKKPHFFKRMKLP